jgi:hypothetical protein
LNFVSQAAVTTPRGVRGGNHTWMKFSGALS